MGRQYLSKTKMASRCWPNWNETPVEWTLQRDLESVPLDNSFVFNTPNQANDLDVRTGAIITEETAAAIKFLKNGKVPGLDMVSAEMLKHGRQCLFKEITDLFNSCWSSM